MPCSPACRACSTPQQPHARAHSSPTRARTAAHLPRQVFSLRPALQLEQRRRLVGQGQLAPGVQLGGTAVVPQRLDRVGGGCWEGQRGGIAVKHAGVGSAAWWSIVGACTWRRVVQIRAGSCRVASSQFLYKGRACSPCPCPPAKQKGSRSVPAAAWCAAGAAQPPPERMPVPARCPHPLRVFSRVHHKDPAPPGCDFIGLNYYSRVRRALQTNSQCAASALAAALHGPGWHHRAVGLLHCSPTGCSPPNLSRRRPVPQGVMDWKLSPACNSGEVMTDMPYAL